VIDPQTPSTVYAVTSSAIFKSTDGGVTWSALNTGLTNPKVYALAVDPQTPSTLYAAIHAYGSCTMESCSGLVGPYVFKSTDGGASWSGVPVSYTPSSFAIDPSTPTTIYAGTYGGGVFKSTDGGDTWTAANTGLTNPGAPCCTASSEVIALAIDPQTPATLYAGTRGGVFKSTDGGGTWGATGLGSFYVRAIAIDPRTPTTLYAGTSGAGVGKSTDGGASWSALNTGLTNLFVNALAIDPQTPTTIYAGTQAGVFALQQQ
jgi:photosystem II stability/assembly factor-like uncharacterized protein